MEINGARVLAKSLKIMGVTKVFGVVGLVVSPILKGLYDEQIEYIGARHEAAAAHMADGWAQLTREPGVCLLPGAPGLTNALSGIVKCHMANTPLLAIVGNNATSKNDRGNLQDMKFEPLVSPYTKLFKTIYAAKRIPEYVRMAFRAMNSGRLGPVCLEIPIDVQLNKLKDAPDGDVSFNTLSAEIWNKTVALPDDLIRTARILCEAQRPVIIGGSGVWWSRAEQEVFELCHELHAPYFGISLARGTIPDDDELSMGVGSPLSSSLSQYAFSHADTILAIGARFNFSLAFGSYPYFAREQKLIQLDIEPQELGTGTMALEIGLAGDAKASLRELIKIIKSTPRNGSEHRQWLQELKIQKTNEWEQYRRKAQEARAKNEIHPFDIMASINELSPRDSIFIRDGSHAGQWIISFLNQYYPGHILSSPNGTLGLMGAGLPLANAAQIAFPGKKVVLYSGDGSFGFYLGELYTAIRNKLSVIIIVHNNQAWGSCKTEQKNTFKIMEPVGVDLDHCRYDQIVESFGGKGKLVGNIEEFEAAYREALDCETVYCINVSIDSEVEFLNSGMLLEIHSKTM
jgi:acetolactate synthase-1/2/3 large subunit